jgi:hypothetical protein
LFGLLDSHNNRVCYGNVYRGKFIQSEWFDTFTAANGGQAHVFPGLHWYNERKLGVALDEPRALEVTIQHVSYPYTTPREKFPYSYPSR